MTEEQKSAIPKIEAFFDEERIKQLKHRLPTIKTLAMLKMEKNFIALEKGYPRQPYASEQQPIRFMIKRIGEELDELIGAYGNNDIMEMMEECADISNLVDYLFEQLSRVKA